MPTNPSRRRRAAPLALLALLAAPAWADGERRARVPLDPSYVQECGSCHVAYPPALLPAASWQRLMGDLAHHFGSDASLDRELARKLTDWLVAHAASGRRAAQVPPQDRITRSAWFLREHDELPAATWQRPAIRSAANCGACHPRADRGEFDEHAIRIPR
ncbi:MAG: diheme cytochrome c [Burkholderiales bacterium]|nr:diheme cytochrome c [Burkholderiales bacterium]